MPRLRAACRRAREGPGGWSLEVIFHGNRLDWRIFLMLIFSNVFLIKVYVFRFFPPDFAIFWFRSFAHRLLVTERHWNAEVNR